MSKPVPQADFDLSSIILKRILCISMTLNTLSGPSYKNRQKELQAVWSPRASNQLKIPLNMKKNHPSSSLLLPFFFSLDPRVDE